MSLLHRLRSPLGAALAFALLVPEVTGCTFIGAGIGAGIDSAIPGPFEERPSVTWVTLENEEPIVVGLANGTRLTGKFIGFVRPTPTDPEVYWLIDVDGIKGMPYIVRASEIKTVAVEVVGKGWLYGGLIGLAVDVAVVIGVVLAVEHTHYNLSSGGSGCFC